jgi:hypothetical protein
MATVAETVKESLLGTSQPEQLSPSSRTTFLKHARRDEDNDELYMGEEEFVNAIAPAEQNYVSSTPLTARPFSGHAVSGSRTQTDPCS